MENRTTGADTIVFIHGLYLTARSWELWEKRYAERGYRVINRGWPGLEGEVEALRRDPSPIARLNVPEILDRYDHHRPLVWRGFHSGTGEPRPWSGGVLLAAGTVRGVLDVPLITIRSNWKVLRNPLFRHRAIMPTAKDFRFAFTNTFSEADSAKAYRKSSAITDLVEFPERAHFTAVQEGWEQVADSALQWALNPATEVSAAAARPLRRVREPGLATTSCT